MSGEGGGTRREGGGISREGGGISRAHPPILEVAGLTVGLPQGLDRAEAVRDVGFTVGLQEIVCLVGESGSGKSVTAAAIMGLLPPNSLVLRAGSIRLEGEELVGASQARLCSLRGSRMAMVFQEPLTALNPIMRVGEQIAEALRIHRPEMGRKAIAQRVTALLEDVRLPDPASAGKAYPHQLSGGQRQRVMIAMALALEPALIVADEPTTALDVTTQAQILRLFRELLTHHKSGLLLITHDFDVVADVADQVVVMRHGEVVERGVPAEVLARPEHPYTRALIEAVPRFRFHPEPAVPPPPLLQVRDLHLTYRSRSYLGTRRETKALDGVSFELAKGETLGLVGESGSGKSTLARCLLGFELPDGGSIRFDGQETGRLSRGALRRLRSRIQMIFQDPFRSLNPRRRIGASVTEGPIHRGLPRGEARARAAELMRLVGLSPDALERYPHEFSGGQRQRICIARALAMEPEVILADEPVAALDVSVQAQVLALFDELQRRIGFSMIFITHDLRVASNVCNRVAVLRQGRIVEIGTAEAVFRHPQEPYTRELLAAVPGHLAEAPPA